MRECPTAPRRPEEADLVQAPDDPEVRGRGSRASQRHRALGEGLDVCVENVGGTLFAALARLMRWNGRLMPIGFTGGEIPSLAMNLNESSPFLFAPGV